MVIGCFNGNEFCGLDKVIREASQQKALSLVNVTDTSCRNLPRKVVISPALSTISSPAQYDSIKLLIGNNPKTNFSIVLNSVYYESVKDLIGDYTNCKYFDSDNQSDEIRKLFGL